MEGSFVCPVDTAATTTVANMHNPENCMMCKNQIHWRPEWIFCVECNDGFMLTSDNECMSRESNETFCTLPAMPFMVEGTDYCVGECTGNYELNEKTMTCVFREWCAVATAADATTTDDGSGTNTAPPPTCECGYGTVMGGDGVCSCDGATIPTSATDPTPMAGTGMPMVWNQLLM